MRLYHFTRPVVLPSILKHGLDRGDCPTSLTEGFNAVNFTTDPEPRNQTWADGSPGKGELRLTVEVPHDENLIPWLRVPKLYHCDMRFFRRISGKNGSKWYVYTGTIPPDDIIEVFHFERGRALTFAEIIAEMGKPAIRGTLPFVVIPARRRAR